MPENEPPEVLHAIARELIDFINQQSGAYMDSLAGFSRNKTRVERQVHRILRRHKGTLNQSGERVVTCTSYEDPTKPDIIINRITPADDYLRSNAPGGDNEQQVARSILIFIYTFWDLEIRPRLGVALNQNESEIKSDVIGDLRLIRNAILHNKGIMVPEKHRGLKILGDMVQSGTAIELTYDQMHRIFALLKQDCARLFLNWTGALATAPFKPEEIKDFAVSTKPLI